MNNKNNWYNTTKKSEEYERGGFYKFKAPLHMPEYGKEYTDIVICTNNNSSHQTFAVSAIKKDNKTPIGNVYREYFERVDYYATKEDCDGMMEANPRNNRCICGTCTDKRLFREPVIWNKEKECYE